MTRYHEEKTRAEVEARSREGAAAEARRMLDEMTGGR